MKKSLLILISLLMLISFSGCKKNNNKDPQPKPTPQPVVETKYTSRLGTYAEIEALMKNYTSKTEWPFFYEGIDDEINGLVYGVWSDSRVYIGNYEDFVEHGVMPEIDLTIVYDENNVIWGLAFYVPFSVPIAELDPELYENVVLAQDMILRAALPELSDSDYKKLADKLSLVTVDALEAYHNGQADPAEFVTTSVDIYLTSSSETAEYALSVEYDSEFKTMMVYLLEK